MNGNFPGYRAQPFSPSRVRLLEGPFKQRQDVHGQYLEAVEPDRLLAPFRIQAGLVPRAERYGGWESRDIGGHSLGHYLSTLGLFRPAWAEAGSCLRITDALFGSL